MNMLKKSLALLLTLCMLISVVPLTVFAADTTDGTAAASETGTDFYRILHLDCGRKYFTKDWIIALINEMAAAGYNQLQLAFGNDGLRFLLDDMSVGSYSDDAVTAAIQAGNKAYYDFGTNELTQTEMDDIISHANTKGISIIPLLNNPGHMNAVVSAASTLTGSSAGYNGSSSTVDLENSAAVAFTKGLIQKYITYFDNQGCTYFNMGADEYANDVYPTGSMGFGALTWAGKYQLYVDYVNDIAAIIKSAGMKPIAFNDGIYFNQNTRYNFDKEITVAFWTSGWSGYQSASASTMAALGHDMINVNGDYYYVLGKNDQWDSYSYTYASNWNNSTFMGSTVSDPLGGMFCIWCDYPNAETETQIAANTRMILRAMAAEMQGKDAASASTDVVPGGFNENGTINETDMVTVTQGDVSVKAPDTTGLTGLTVAEVENPEITVENAAAIKAWEMTPTTATGDYTGSATVSVPVPASWTKVRGGVLQTANGDYKDDIGGDLKDGVFTFTVPHFSTVFAYNLTTTAEGGDEGSSGGTTGGDTSDPVDHTNHRIELNVGQRVEFDCNGANVNNVNTTEEIQTNPAGVATVMATHVYQEGTGVTVTPVTSVTDGNAYYIINSDGKYLSAAPGWVDDYSNAVEWNISQSEFYAMFGITAYVLSYNNQYLAADGKDSFKFVSDNFSAVPFESTNGKIYCQDFDTYYTVAEVTGSANINKSTYTVEGIARGTTKANINGAEYTIIVHSMVDITIKYVDSEDNTNVIMTDTKTVRDDATSIDLSHFNHDGKYYTVNDTTLEITPATVTEYTVTVTESEVNLDTVADLTIEYWQTSSRVNAGTDNSSEMNFKAKDAYSEEGITLLGTIPSTGTRGDIPVVYWRSRLLPSSYHQESNDSDTGKKDSTWNGTGFTKVRYWNNSWEVYTEATETAASEWKQVLNSDQLVAYYMCDLNLADEVKVGVADWATKGNMVPETGATDGHNSIVFQVIYEGGTSFPANVTTDAEAIGNASFIVHHWTPQRGIGTISITQIKDFAVWKVTATTGTHTLTSNNTIESISWLNNERVLFENENNPVSQYTLYNPAQPDDTKIDDDHANLYWADPEESILIRIYIKAIETEDSLKAIYFDEKFNTTLAEFNYSVQNGIDFDNIVDSNGQLVEPPFSAAFDATPGYGIENIEGKTQWFETDLTKVAVTNNRYNVKLYKYERSVISEDRKTITHYYTIDASVLSPNFVADFGLPLKFPLSQVLGGEGQVDLVDYVTVNPTTKYGTLSYDNDNEEFTYTPTQILPTIDVLTINIKFKTEQDVSTTNVGVTPATTVYYDDSFIGTGTGWNRVGTVTVTPQDAEVMNSVDDKGNPIINKVNNYGYDPAYASVSGASHGTYLYTQTIGATTSFEFTGTGIQVFAYATTGTGYVSAKITDANGAIVKVYMVNTDIDDVTSKNTGSSLHGLPIISLVDLQGLTHGKYTVTLTKIMDTNPVNIDGIRVFGTIADSTIFTADLEDNPAYYEVRDAVLNAIGAFGVESEDYKTMVKQVYDSAAGAAAIITDGSIVYSESDKVQDLLDNGPKNELYLFKNQTLTFKVTTSRVMQLGLKAPAGSANFTITVTPTGGTAKTLSLTELKSTVDMFYTLADKPSTETEYTVSIQVGESSDILSVTLLKICDDPNAAFVPLTIEDIETILASDAPTADASLTVNITNRSGKVMNTVTLTANGVAGETHTFTEEEILAAISDVLGKDYIAARGSSIDDVEVVYGESDVLSVDKNDDIMRIHKINNYKSRPGKGSDKGNGKHK